MRQDMCGGRPSFSVRPEVAELQELSLLVNEAGTAACDGLRAV